MEVQVKSYSCNNEGSIWIVRTDTHSTLQFAQHKLEASGTGYASESFHFVADSLLFSRACVSQVVKAAEAVPPHANARAASCQAS
jgi:hypothetical protein